ncbi:PD-(D/E)XK nuclease family protein [Actinomyces minihominis]|uniref:PD-(D/E)XK nuclease family protein n=1 Tax=Actinomyces minihominis TaxID=2002838 RepID=UPI000C07CBE2|nr:PD-(D/E)XK nuclease family protein [Actinomyces minihominis]
MANRIDLDASQLEAMRAVDAGLNTFVTGAPGSGKSTVALQALVSAPRKPEGWAPALVIVPDRRRAQLFESRWARVAATELSGLRADGSHRLVRSLSSYAYLVLGLWLIEREEALPRPVMLSGAAEDAWLADFLEGEGADSWGFTETVRKSPLFRMEVRNVMARSGQAGLLPEDLGVLGETLDVPLWTVAGAAYREYAGEGRAFSEQTANVDAARIPLIAANILRRWDTDAASEGVTARRPLPGRVIVDDAQDLPISALNLLGTMSELGSQVIVTANPDEATAGYRGGVFDLGARLAKALSAQRVALKQQHRLPPDAVRVLNGVESWLGTLQKSGSQPEVAGAGAGGQVSAKLLTTGSHMSEQVAAILREGHLYDKMPWREMAVIVRHSGEVDGIQRALARNGVPVQSGERPVILGRVPLVRSILECLVDEPDSEDPLELDRRALELTLSPLVRADSLALFRVLRDFRATEKADGPRGASALLEAVSNRTFEPGSRADRSVSKRLKVAAKLWTQRKTAARQPVGEGLWTVWSQSGLAPILRETALEDSSRGRAASEDLDSVLALFRKADLWEQERSDRHSAQADAATFAREILSQGVATDPLVPRGLSEAGVWVVTPAQAAGRQWNLVVVAGLSEGTWPASSRRGLGDLPRLDSVLAEAEQRGWRGQESIERFLPDRAALVSADSRSLAASRRVEEARLFLVALSRSSGDVHLLGIENEDTAPSSFLLLLADSGRVKLREPDRASLGDRGQPLTIEALIASMRKHLVSVESTEEEKRDAARVLALLWSEGISQADPALWGTTGSLSTENPILDQGPVRLGPSGVQSAQECSLQWFLQDVGGRNQVLHEEALTLDGATIGTIMHSLAERHPHAGSTGMVEALRDEWDRLGLTKQTFWERVIYAEMEAMAAKMGAYFATFKGEVLTEESIRFEVEDIIVSGRADRVEIGPDGSAKIIDIKTGRPGSKTAGAESPQLAAYQVGIAERGFDPGGAALLFLQASEPLSEQAPFGKAQVAETKRQLAELSGRLGGSRVMASPAPQLCRLCPFRQVCPAQVDSTRSSE